MGCTHSKKKSKGKTAEKKQNGVCDGGQRAAGGQDVYLEKQLEQFEWQLRTLKEVLSANGNPERAELLKQHADEEVCALVLSLLDKVRTETAADLNVLHERRSKCAAEGYERSEAALKRRHEEEKTRLTEAFRAAEDGLKVEVQQLAAELQDYDQLTTRVRESTFKKDLQRNIQVLPPGGQAGQVTPRTTPRNVPLISLPLQAHGSPGAFWESEQESLLFVIEMKSEQVQEQSRKLQNMEALVKKNLALEDQIVHVLQQNEDLKVRIDNCQTLIQQISREEQDLRVALERQTAMNQNLSQEKEQLMFKLRHRDSYPSIHLPTMVQELAPR